MATGTAELKRLEAIRRWMASNRVMSCTTKDVTLVLHESSLFPVEANDPTKFSSTADDYDEETPQQRIRRMAEAAEQRKANGDDDA